jgi:hypothetical protein
MEWSALNPFSFEGRPGHTLVWYIPMFGSGYSPNRADGSNSPPKRFGQTLLKGLWTPPRQTDIFTFFGRFSGERIIIIFLFRGEITSTSPRSVGPVDVPRPPLRSPPPENTYIGPGNATRLPAAFYFVAGQTVRRLWGFSLFSFFFFNVALSGWKCLGIRRSNVFIVLAYDWRALGRSFAYDWRALGMRLACFWPLV